MQVTSIFYNDSENVTSEILPLTRAAGARSHKTGNFKEPEILVFTRKKL